MGVAKWPELPVQPNVIGAQSRSLALRLGDRRNGKMQDQLPSTKHPLNAGEKEKHILSHASLLSRLVPLSNVLLGGVLLSGSMPLSTGRSIRHQHLKR